jgi:hypothetical protein
VSWVLLVNRGELVDAADIPVPSATDFRRTVRFAPAGHLRLANTETGEVREWGSGLGALLEGHDEYKRLCERIAVVLGPAVVRRWRDGDESLDLAAEAHSTIARFAAFARHSVGCVPDVGCTCGLRAAVAALGQVPAEEVQRMAANLSADEIARAIESANELNPEVGQRLAELLGADAEGRFRRARGEDT